MEEMRLQKYLAMANVASRRASEQLIADGRISVNGVTVTEPGTKVGEKDEVRFDGEIVKIVSRKYYIMLNKPAGYVTTSDDEFGRKTVLDLTCDISDRIYPVGRLDADTEGLLLLTNDGDFAYAVSHPGHKVEKTYHALVAKIPSKSEMNMLRRGVEIDGRYTLPAKAGILKTGKSSALVEIKICEGRNRQVRKMMEAVGHKVINLQRVAVGSVTLGNLPLGKWRHLTKAETESLKKGGKKND